MTEQTMVEMDGAVSWPDEPDSVILVTCDTCGRTHYHGNEQDAKRPNIYCEECGIDFEEVR